MFGRKNVISDNAGDDGNIVVLKQTAPNTCGGTDATLDKSAPREISSRDMYLFDFTTALGGFMPEESENPLAYISAFAARCDGGTFVYLKTSRRSDHRECRTEAALIKGDLMPRLVDFVNENRLAENNGYHSTTHGLPENFGGSALVLYAGGEKISYSDNQAPIAKLLVAEKNVFAFQRLFKRRKGNCARYGGPLRNTL